MTRRTVAVIPGVGVRRYLLPTVDAVRDRGWEVTLLPGLGQPAMASDLHLYADQIGPGLARGPLDLLVGLSVGCQAAALVATRYRPSARLVLVGPTVDPACRSVPRLMARWVLAGTREPSDLLPRQAADWRDAGPRSLMRVVRSAVALRLEDMSLPRSVRTCVVHADSDLITSHEYAASLAATWGGQFVSVPHATHSWPYGDPDRFAGLMEQLLDD